MGLAFSGLSLVPSVAAELDAGDAVHGGAIVGHHGAEPFSISAEPLPNKEAECSDSESGLALPLCGINIVTAAQQQAPLDQLSLFASLWTTALGNSEAASPSAGGDSPSILESQQRPATRDGSQERGPAALASGAKAAAAGSLLQRKFAPVESDKAALDNPTLLRESPQQVFAPGAGDRGGIAATEQQPSLVTLHRAMRRRRIPQQEWIAAATGFRHPCPRSCLRNPVCKNRRHSGAAQISGPNNRQKPSPPPPMV
jgi:hypothetical protein